MAQASVAGPQPVAAGRAHTVRGASRHGSARSTISVLAPIEMQPIEMQVNGTREREELQFVHPKRGFFRDDGTIGTSATMTCDYGTARLRHRGGFASYATPAWTTRS